MRPLTSRDWIVLSLLVATLAVYAPVLDNDFVVFDDPVLVTANPRVLSGFSWESIRWAFTSAEASNWFPLTRLSFMLDCQLFGLNAAWHHATSAVLHAISTV